jgi:predicted MFS family arabinose efflux permease
VILLVTESRPFLGWRIVGVAFMAQLLSVGLSFAAFGVFVVPLSEEFGASRAELGVGLAIVFLVMGLMGPQIGHWLDRGLARTLMMTGSVLAGAGLMVVSRATELWQLGLIFCGVVGAGAALLGATPSMALVANWFVRRRGLAMGLTVAGATVATIVVPPLAAHLIDAAGWRNALLILGGGSLVIGFPIFATQVIARPELVGQAPDGDPVDESAAAVEAPAPVETRALVRDPRLWMLAVGFGLIFTSPILMTSSVIPFGEDLGFSRLDAAWFFTAMGPFSLLGKVVFGAVADRLPPRIGIWIVVIGNVGVWLLLYTSPGYSLFLVVGAVYGLAIGAVGPLNGLVIARCFGRDAFGRASGLGGLAGLPLIACAPIVAGLIYDTTGSYQPVFLLQAGLLLAGGILLSFVRIPRSG